MLGGDTQAIEESSAACGLESLPPNDSDAITNHLRECATCQGKVLESVNFASRIAALTPSGGKDWREQRRYARIPVDEPASIRVLRPSSTCRRSVARVLQTSREGLRLRVSEFLHPGATIQIHMADTIAFGEVRYCQPTGSAFQAGVQVRDSFPAPAVDSLEWKRREPRIAVRAIANIRTTKTADLHQVIVLDVSRSGMRVQCGTTFPIGTQIEVIYSDVRIWGEIRYARELDSNEFNMGIIADNVTGQDGVEMSDTDLRLLFNLQ